MTEDYLKAVEKVTAANNQAYLDFMARRLVEMAGGIIMSYLMLMDAKTTESFTASATVYTNLVQAEVAKHCDFINNFNVEELAAYGVK